MISGSVGPISTKFSPKSPKPRSLDDRTIYILNFFCEGQEGRKTPPKTENFDMGVQFFGNDSKTNQDIKNRNGSLASTINSEDNDI